MIDVLFFETSLKLANIKSVFKKRIKNFRGEHKPVSFYLMYKNVANVVYSLQCPLDSKKHFLSITMNLGKVCAQYYLIFTEAATRGSIKEGVLRNLTKFTGKLPPG